MTRFVKAQKYLILFLIGAGLMLFYYSLPDRLFDDPYATVLEDRSGQLLSAAIAKDGQWRFPESNDVPEKFARAITCFEDKRFWSHPGVDVFALARALRQNVKAGRVVSGGSTLTMQVVRLSQRNPPRTVFRKILECILAARVELRYSKREILGLYASHAPFGGNVVGIEAACWRYFGRGSRELSWGEAALLAVLPNNPSLMHLARNRRALIEKRNFLLEKLYKEGAVDRLSFELATAESLPEQPMPLPRYAPHLLDRAGLEGLTGMVVKSTVDRGLQLRAEQVVYDYYKRMSGKQIFNAAALILDIKSGDVLAYVGNSPSGVEHQESVDVIRSPRSTGSILKPFLFAAQLTDGKLLPKMLVSDVPVLINGFAPKNFSRLFDGAIPADKALIRSLNIPAVLSLREYRYEKFYNLLEEIGMTTLSQPPDHYGLSLVLGGAEGTLWDITGMYASAARTLNNYFERPGKNKYDKKDFHTPRYLHQSERGADDRFSQGSLEPSSFLSAASLWSTFESMKELHRPAEERGWVHFSSSKPVAWKTGTSFGFRDGWAVGVNPEYAVGVWVGNADGEGRPGLTGTEAAAPLLFDVFSLLPGQPWFQKPESELADEPVCSLSGHRPSAHCEMVDTLSIPTAGLTSAICNYHRLIHVTPDRKFRVHLDCVPADKMKSVSWFVLPALQEYYYKSKNLSYMPIPPFREDCQDPSSIASMEIVYPKTNSKIFLPVQLDGQAGSTVFEAAHRNSKAVVYWHLDGRFIGSTKRAHQLLLSPGGGKHMISIVDDAGETIQRTFEVISSR